MKWLSRSYFTNTSGHIKLWVDVHYRKIKLSAFICNLCNIQQKQHEMWKCQDMRPNLDLYVIGYSNYERTALVLMLCEGTMWYWMKRCVWHVCLFFIVLNYCTSHMIVQLWKIKCSKPGYSNVYITTAYSLKKGFWLCCDMDFIYCLYVFIIKTHIYALTRFASFQQQFISFFLHWEHIK